MNPSPVAEELARKPATYLPAIDRPVHPVCAMFPVLSGDSPAFRDLVGSIEENGLIEPIVLCGDAILDGRHRYLACLKADVEPRFVQFDSLGLTCDPATYAHDKNVARRDLTPDQRVAIEAKYAAYVRDIQAAANERRREAAKAQPRDGNRFDETQVGINRPRPDTAGRAREHLQAAANVSERKARQAIEVAQNAPELLDNVAAGAMPLRDAAKRATERKPSSPKHKRATKPYDIERAIDAINRALRKAFAVCPEQQRRQLKRRIKEIADDL